MNFVELWEFMEPSLQPTESAPTVEWRKHEALTSAKLGGWGGKLDVAEIKGKQESALTNSNSTVKWNLGDKLKPVHISYRWTCWRNWRLSVQHDTCHGLGGPQRTERAGAGGEGTSWDAELYEQSKLAGQPPWPQLATVLGALCQLRNADKVAVLWVLSMSHMSSAFCGQCWPRTIQGKESREA